MDERVTLQHVETGHLTEVPDLPDVLADFADRGWYPFDVAAAREAALRDPRYGTYDAEATATGSAEPSATENEKE